MKARIIVVAVLATVLAAAASTATGGTRADAGSITVWLQVDARSGWSDVVANATKAFQAQHPGVQVNVEYQEWNTHLTKLDASIAGGTAPDVVEMGNTEMTKYMAAGAFAPLTKSVFPNSSTWLKGLESSATFKGKLYGVPYYAGSRAVIYRKDFFKKAGITKLPTTLDEFVAAGQKLNQAYGKTKNFSAFYFAGRDWYSGLSYVYAYGGQIAKTKSGQWVGALDSPAAVKGLTQDEAGRAGAFEGEQDHRRGTPLPDRAVRARPGGVVHRPGLAVGLRARSEGRQPQARPADGRLPHARHHRGHLPPGVPRRVGPRGADHEQEP